MKPKKKKTQNNDLSMKSAETTNAPEVAAVSRLQSANVFDFLPFLTSQLLFKCLVKYKGMA